MPAPAGSLLLHHYTLLFRAEVVVLPSALEFCLLLVWLSHSAAMDGNFTNPTTVPIFACASHLSFCLHCTAHEQLDHVAPFQLYTIPFVTTEHLHAGSTLEVRASAVGVLSQYPATSAHHGLGPGGPPGQPAAWLHCCSPPCLLISSIAGLHFHRRMYLPACLEGIQNLTGEAVGIAPAGLAQIHGHLVLLVADVLVSALRQ